MDHAAVVETTSGGGVGSGSGGGGDGSGISSPYRKSTILHSFMLGGSDSLGE